MLFGNKRNGLLSKKYPTVRLPLRVFCRPFSSMKSKGNGGKRSRWGRRARFIRSDEPGLRPDGPLAGGSRSPLHPPFAVCSGRIKLSHPASCPNTKSVSCKHLPPPSSRLHYRRACERELGWARKAFPLEGKVGPKDPDEGIRMVIRMFFLIRCGHVFPSPVSAADSLSRCGSVTPRDVLDFSLLL